MAEQDKITENRDTDLPVDEQPTILETPESKSIVFQETEMLSKLEEMSQIDEIPVGGVTNIEPDVIGAIAGHAAQTVPGVASLGTASLRRSISERLGSAERWSRGVEVELGRKEAIIDINLRLVYGYSVPSTVIAVRNQVADSLYRYAGLVAKEINIRVVGIDFPRKMPGRVE
ncbi:MAG: Asp23/Gls24 family envelope stress response protein [Dehalococcoidia bacterium]|nr:Asp23/Gls24 family envelope stress response protein [Dehalococcoidia bacterium]